MFLLNYHKISSLDKKHKAISKDRIWILKVISVNKFKSKKNRNFEINHPHPIPLNFPEKQKTFLLGLVHNWDFKKWYKHRCQTKQHAAPNGPYRKSEV